MKESHNKNWNEGMSGEVEREWGSRGRAAQDGRVDDRVLRTEDWGVRRAECRVWRVECGVWSHRGLGRHWTLRGRTEDGVRRTLGSLELTVNRSRSCFCLYLPFFLTIHIHNHFHIAFPVLLLPCTTTCHLPRRSSATPAWSSPYTT